jgi:hypothetical protein
VGNWRPRADGASRVIFEIARVPSDNADLKG